MISDPQYASLPRPSGELAHGYGPRVHVLSQPWPMTMLARLCGPRAVQPEVNRLAAALFDWLLAQVVSREFACAHAELPTRMLASNPQGIYAGQVVDPELSVVVVDIARAGMLPGLRFFEGLSGLLPPERVRQDHVFMNRITGEHGEVVGVNLSGSKIGGPVDGAILLVPDPMAATGSSAARVLRMYRDEVPGNPAATIAVHLIVTPEYLARVTGEFPELRVYAVRLDRGLSPEAVLAQPPGARWDQERGLDEHQYIVPGGGGFGEVMNNSWV